MTKTGKLEAWLPYALPVLGGLLGVVWVNLNKMDFLNPVVAVVIGVILGRVASIFAVRALRKSRRRDR